MNSLDDHQEHLYEILAERGIKTAYVLKLQTNCLCQKFVSVAKRFVPYKTEMAKELKAVPFNLWSILASIFQSSDIRKRVCYQYNY